MKKKENSKQNIIMKTILLTLNIVKQLPTILILWTSNTRVDELLTIQV